jgi:hypothetical protein
MLMLKRSKSREFSYDIVLASMSSVEGSDNLGIDASSEDEFRYRPNDPTSLADYLEFVADELEWGMLTAGGKDLTRLHEASKRIWAIAEEGWRLAQLD